MVYNTECWENKKAGDVGWPHGLVVKVLAAKPEDLALIPRAHMVERED